MRRRGMFAVVVVAALALPAYGAESPCAKADTLRAGGALDAARTAYGEAAKEPANAGCVIAGLRELDALSRDKALKLVRQLDDRGLDGEARTLLEETLKTYPGTTVPKDLDPLLDGERTPQWAEFLERWTPDARSAGEVLLLILVAVVVAQFVFSRVHRRLRIGEFVGPGSDDAKTTAVSAEFQALVRARLDKLSSAQPGGRVDFASGGPVAIPATVTQSAPQVKLVEALIDLVQHLFPANDRTLSGLLLAKSPRGLGVVVTLNSRWGGPRSTRTIWIDDLPPAALESVEETSYLPLVVAVAAWALAEFNPRRFRALGTSNPLSYAAFAAGANAQGATW